jgi:carboxymethylenebutenolidase
MTPDGNGPWPPVIFYMDGGGIRPAVNAMARRLANAGYVVLLPDLFYRYGPYGPFIPAELFGGDMLATLGPLMASTGNDKAAEHTEAFLAYLDTHGDVMGSKVGAVGFCMGGGIAITAAATYPDRFAPVASFHGGNLASDGATSPHLLAPKLRAEVYVASAEKDPYYPAEMAELFEKTLADAAIRYRAETIPRCTDG